MHTAVRKGTRQTGAVTTSVALPGPTPGNLRAYRLAWTFVLRQVATVVALTLVVCLVASCPRPRASGPQVTGTCEGACDYYQACTRSDDAERFAACVSECNDFFSDRQALVELERLACDELVAFIEGPSGRGPGQR